MVVTGEWLLPTNAITLRRGLVEFNSRLLSASTLLCTYSLQAMGDTTLAATRDVLAAISSVGKIDLLMILMSWLSER